MDYDTSKVAPFVVATTEAPSYRRIAVQRMRAEGLTAEEIKRSKSARGFGIRDGHSTGDICPAGFLPQVTGNVRTDSIVNVYRGAHIFRLLHEPHSFNGRCGICEYHAFCRSSSIWR